MNEEIEIASQNGNNKENEHDDSPKKRESINIPKLQVDQAAVQDKTLLTKRGPKLSENCHLTIVDMGNGCWTHHHFTS